MKSGRTQRGKSYERKVQEQDQAYRETKAGGKSKRIKERKKRRGESGGERTRKHSSRSKREQPKAEGRRESGSGVGAKRRRRGREGRQRREQQPERKEVQVERVRVGMGYRVTWEDEKKGRRSFELGFSELKSYSRKKGVEATLAANKMGRTRKGEAQRVSNTVHDREQRRRYNDYTGKGVMPKAKAATQTLKAKKPAR